MIRIDGSFGEGGGQIISTALALSCITGRPFEIYNIRKGRKKPGLMPQHLTDVRAAKAISGAVVMGDELGSARLSFSPGKVRGGEYCFDVSELKGSAGSVSLVIQSIIPPLALAGKGSRLVIEGGTHVEWSPTFHYLRDVLFPFLSKIGIDASLEIERWGWYPQGGGSVCVHIRPAKRLSPIEMSERGELARIRALSVVSNLPISIAERQRERGLFLLREEGLDADIEIVEAPSPGKGTLFFILAEFDNIRAGFSALGAIGKRAEQVAEEAARDLLDFLGSEGALDPHLADQVIPYLALAEGSSTITTSKITRHLLTNIWVTRKFLPVRAEIEGREGSFGRVRIAPLYSSRIL